MTTLINIGFHKLGVEKIEFSQCIECKTDFPHATSVASLYWDRRTPTAMCNGKPISTCPYCDTTKEGNNHD